MQEVTVYLRHRREPMKFLARRFDAQLDLRSRGAQELSYEAPNGRTVRAYLDPREVVAMVPTLFAEKEPLTARTELEVAEERRREIERARKEGFERGRQQAQLDAYTKEFERQVRLRNENRRKKRASQTPELDRQIVRVLLNFREAGIYELRGRLPASRAWSLRRSTSSRDGVAGALPPNSLPASSLRQGLQTASVPAYRP